MTWRPRLNTVCGRCGKPRGLRHDCVSNRTRKATIKPRVTFGTCPKCKKPQGNPLTHACRPRSDFKRRKADYTRQQKAANRKTRQAHDYQACTDRDCPRPVCVAYRTGYHTGNHDGYDHGWQVGYAVGHADAYTATTS
jgi:hypothetical protein